LKGVAGESAFFVLGMINEYQCRRIVEDEDTRQIYIMRRDGSKQTRGGSRHASIKGHWSLTAVAWLSVQGSKDRLSVEVVGLDAWKQRESHPGVTEEW